LIGVGHGSKLNIMAANVPESVESDEPLIAVIVRRGRSDAAMRAARGAFEMLYQRRAPLLLAFLSSRVASGDRDDLHQEIWVRVWNRLPEQFQGGNFRAWLHQIARNVIVDHGRKRKPEAFSEPESLPDGRSRRPDDRLIEQERAEALRRCMERLEARTAELVRGRLAGESYQEICARLVLPPPDAHKLFHLAKNQLKTCVEHILG
jgi:RNA polymerase sigma-70 factor, ECF subfamily